MTIHQYKSGLEKLCDQYEDLWIEKEAYREYLLRFCMVSASDLDAAAAASLADSDKRKETKQLFSAMRDSLMKAGLSASIEELLLQPPPSGKSN